MMVVYLSHPRCNASPHVDPVTAMCRWLRREYGVNLAVARAEITRRYPMIAASTEPHDRFLESTPEEREQYVQAWSRDPGVQWLLGRIRDRRAGRLPPPAN
jgi:hypothetical protein